MCMKNNGWETVSQTHPAEPSTVTRCAWETLMLNSYVFLIRLLLVGCQPLRVSVKSHLRWIKWHFLSFDFNALLLQCDIILRYDSDLEVSSQSLHGMSCAERQELNFTC